MGKVPERLTVKSRLIMKVYKTTPKGSGVDVLYKVDPTRLSVQICSTSILDDQMAEECVTTFECFYFEGITAEPEVPNQLDELPAFIDGSFYFGTEEEAQDFVRKQIGM